jgi:hypothetical protein
MTQNQTKAIIEILSRTMNYLNTTEIDYSIEEVNELIVMEIDETKYKIKPSGEVVKI